MAQIQKQLDEEIKKRFLEQVGHFLEESGEEILQVKSNEIALPVVDSAGNERWLVLTFKVPTGQRNTGEEYDGYTDAEMYAQKVAEKKAKAEEKAKKAEAEKAKRAKAKAEKK